jgi:hypothetical protein
VSATAARSTTPAARPGAEWAIGALPLTPALSPVGGEGGRDRDLKGYRAARAGGSARSAGFALFFSARSSSQIVIGAAMNQVE